jgi:V8-like Glu-specific endopeptidase
MALSKTQWLAFLSLSAASLLPACSSESPNSRTTDIFVEDQGGGANGNARRHAATEAERHYTINMNGCSGSLLAPELLITAAHCPIVVGFTYTSGSAINRGKKDDIQITEVAERNETLDYQILRIKWRNGSFPTTQFFPKLIATSSADVVRGQGDGQGDEIFTVGFPADKFESWGATYAEGRAKAFADGELYYNIGTINGNSGGGVWKKKDGMLVSLTNGGVHNLDEAGWNTSKASNADAWNTGVAMWVAYAQSKILKDTFPNGRNKFSVVVSKDVFMAIGEEDRSAADTYTLYASVPADSAKVTFCAVADVNLCDENANGFTALKEFKTVGDRKIFKASRATALDKTPVISVLVDDKGGNRSQAQIFSFGEKIGGAP